jgi:hypothetical protein
MSPSSHSHDPFDTKRSSTRRHCLRKTGDDKSTQEFEFLLQAAFLSAYSRLIPQLLINIPKPILNFEVNSHLVENIKFSKANAVSISTILNLNFSYHAIMGGHLLSPDCKPELATLEDGKIASIV